MRINFVGNVCNNHYVLAKGLRDIGVDARLYLEPGVDAQSHPESEDAGLAGHLPDWISFLPDTRRRGAPMYQTSPEAIAILADCDLLHAHGRGAIFADMTGQPFVWHPFGEDFASWTGYHRKMLLGTWSGLPVPKIPYLTLPNRTRRMMRHADAILLGWHNRLWKPGYDLLQRYHLTGRIARFHLAIDTEKFQPVPTAGKQRLRQALLPGVASDGPLLFHPTRILFTDPGSRMGYKGNDRLFRALGALAGNGGRFTLVMVDKGGGEEVVARQMIAQLGFAERTHWIKAVPRHQLVEWYQASDLAIESFYTGAIGSMPLEAMACGTPVMMHLQTSPEADDRLFLDPLALYPELPPLLRCRTDDEILAQFQAVMRGPSLLPELGIQGRHWVEKYVGMPASAARLRTIYEDVLAQRTA